jgi:hypothetical protein
MSASHSTQWFWSDWLGDQGVRRLTLAERGLWIDLLALMAAASPAGHLCDGSGNPLSDGDIARLTNAPSAEEVGDLIASILRKGVASRDRAGRLFNRRMIRDAQKRAEKEALSAKRAANGRLGGAATRLKWNVNPGLPWQMPQQMPRQSLESLPYQERNTSSSFGAARAKNAHGVGPGARGNGHSLEKQPRLREPSADGGAGSLAVETASRRPHETAEKKAAAEEEQGLTGYEHLVSTSYFRGGGQ